MPGRAFGAVLLSGERSALTLRPRNVDKVIILWVGSYACLAGGGWGGGGGGGGGLMGARYLSDAWCTPRIGWYRRPTAVH